MKVYGYARVSSVDQNLDRQLDQLVEYGIDKRYILCDKQSGKDFNRRNYLALVGTDEVAPRLNEGDLLVITSLDRLGRNYSEIREQWQHITQGLKVDIKVLDMPMLDTSNSNENLDKRFIADLVPQILAYVAEKERRSIRERQRQGIESAKARGKHLGRPVTKYPEGWPETIYQIKQGKLTATAAMNQLGLKRTTFYKLLNQ